MTWRDVAKRAAVAALREIVAGLDDGNDEAQRRTEQMALAAAAKSALALGATEELREMLRACVADTVASAGNVANVETWTINLSVANVRAFLAATDAKEGGR